MSNETKRDVLEGLLESYMYSADMVIDDISTDGMTDRLNLGNIIASTRYRYAAALPDDLPVIPKAVGVSIKEQKAKQSLGGALFDAIFAANELGRKNVGPVVNWMVDNDETYANAWLTGVWRVEETGEIVKVEVTDDEV